MLNFSSFIRLTKSISSSSYRNLQLLRCYSSTIKNAPASKTSSSTGKKFNNFVNSDFFITDPNEHLIREELFAKEIGGKRLICEKALPQDLPVIVDFFSTYFNQNEVLTGTLNLTKEEGAELYNEVLSHMETFIMRDGNKFVGMVSAHNIQANQFPERKAHLVHQKDYGKIIDAGPFKNRKSNTIVTLLEVCEAKILQHLTFPCTYCYAEMIGIHPKYFGKNLGMILNNIMVDYFKKRGAKYMLGVATSDASFKLHYKIPGVILLDKIPYADFLDHGRKPFENAIGGNKYAYPGYWKF